MNEQTKVQRRAHEHPRTALFWRENLFWRITPRTQATNQLLWVMEDKIAEEAVVLDEIDVLLQVTL